MPNPSELERQAQLATYDLVDLLPGSDLPNGYTILAVHLTKDGGLILAKDSNGQAYRPYVSWRLAPNLDPRSTYSGSYHRTLDGARLVYHERLTEYSTIKD
jgi:hypothetical protein